MNNPTQQIATDLSAFLTIASGEEIEAFQTLLLTATMGRLRRFASYSCGDQEIAADAVYQFIRGRLAAIADMDREILDLSEEALAAIDGADDDETQTA